jgi:hypothetical protein
MPQFLNETHEGQAYVRGPAAGNFTEAYAAAGFRRDRANASRLATSGRAPDKYVVNCRQDAVMESELNHEVVNCCQDAVMALGLNHEAVMCRQDAVMAPGLNHEAVNCRQDAVMESHGMIRA